jgi:hypothetical protein
VGSSRCCQPGTSWGATGRPTYWRRSTNCAVTGHRTSWRRCYSTRRGPTPFSGCQKRARQWEGTYRNLQVTGEERIKESNRDAAGCSTKNSFCCPRSYLVCPSSSSSIAPKASKGWLPEICRPLMKNVGVPDCLDSVDVRQIQVHEN